MRPNCAPILKNKKKSERRYSVMRYVKSLKTLMLFLRIKDGEIREWENSFKRGKSENKN